MREILFRGKSRYTGVWVEGYFSMEVGRIPYLQWLEYDGYYHEEAVEECAVILDTVGEYTGLTDKNGKKIFEGDIVRYTFDSPDDPTATEYGLKVRIGRVFWSDWRAAFAVTAGRRGSAALNNDVARYVRGRSIYEYVQGANTVEIIGNIYDNPESLEGENNG